MAKIAKHKMEPRFRAEVLDELMQGVQAKDLLDAQGMFKELKKALIERALEAEMGAHLFSESEMGLGNCRNGYSSKTLRGEHGEVRIDVPRDRQSRFDPILIGKYCRQFPGFDEKIVSMYASGLSTRDIQAQVQELYGVEVSPQLVSQVTDAVLDEVKQWQSRALDTVYPVVYFDALMLKIQSEGMVRNRAVYLALGIDLEGKKQILGLWLDKDINARGEGARFWLSVVSELKNRGVEDILIAVVDGLKGFPQAIEAVFPKTTVQTCIVHLIRNSMKFASWKERKNLAAALKPIYQASSVESAQIALDEFESGPWGQKYPQIPKAWKNQWPQVIPFFSFAKDVRTLIYTTNAIESMHSQIRKTLRNRNHFSSDQAAIKLVWLALDKISQKWTQPTPLWHDAKAAFAIEFPDRFTIGHF